MHSITQCAPAKLNLHLGIYSQLDGRGYHRADSLMAALDLADVVHVCAPSGSSAAQEPEVVCNPPIDVAPQKNTAYRAAVALARKTGRVPNVHIQIEKHVPDQAGMGGSSSDAAAVLLALCELWDIDCADSVVAEAARSVGADVPFFLDPVPTLLKGAGDVVSTKFSPFIKPIPVVLVRPAGPGVSTPAAYAAFDERPSQPSDPSRLCEVLQGKQADAQQVALYLANNLDPVACRLLPRVAEVRSWLLAQDEVVGGQVTGSGSCVFALCNTDVEGQRVVDAARQRFGFDVWTHLAHLV